MAHSTCALKEGQHRHSYPVISHTPGSVLTVLGLVSTENFRGTTICQGIPWKDTNYDQLFQKQTVGFAEMFANIENFSDPQTTWEPWKNKGPVFWDWDSQIKFWDKQLSCRELGPKDKVQTSNGKSTVLTEKNEMTRRSHVAQAVDEETIAEPKAIKQNGSPISV